MDSLLTQNENPREEVCNSSHKPQGPLPSALESESSFPTPEYSSQELESSSRKPQLAPQELQSSAQLHQPLPQALSTSHTLHQPSQLENQGASTHNGSVYQYPPTWVPEFSEPESGSCDELHEFSSLPQEDNDILTLDDDDLFPQDEEYFVYQEKEDLEPPSKRQRLSHPSEQSSLSSSDSNQPSDFEDSSFDLPREILDHLPVPIWGRCNNIRMLGCRRHAALRLPVKRTPMMCPGCDLPLCIFCYLPHHIELTHLEMQ